jgi:BolA protein
MKKRIEEKLREKLNPSFLEVKNNSHLHAGHIESDDSGETHFAIIITSEELKNLSKVAAHRKVNEVVKDEFLKGLHALEIKCV